MIFSGIFKMLKHGFIKKTNRFFRQGTHDYEFLKQFIINSYLV